MRTFTSECTDSVFVDADVFLLQMAINNLIDNAIKYSSKETNIHVGLVGSNASLCRLSIADEGKGILPENKQKIFEKFY
jgi:signal transduction histidine kinase